MDGAGYLAEGDALAYGAGGLGSDGHRVAVLHFLIDAIHAYEQAVKLEPEAYKESDEEFLLRNSLK